MEANITREEAFQLLKEYNTREVIERGADMLGWELDVLLQRTIDALKTFRD